MRRDGVGKKTKETSPSRERGGGRDTPDTFAKGYESFAEARKKRELQEKEEGRAESLRIEKRRERRGKWH